MKQPCKFVNLKALKNLELGLKGAVNSKIGIVYSRNGAVDS